MPSPRPLPRCTLIACAFAAVLAALVLLAPAAAQPKKEKAAPPKADAKLAELLAPVRDSHKVPAAFAAVIQGDELLAVAAVGVRKEGESTAVTINDQVHIGSDTKAMTATLIAMLVEKKKLRWDSTIGQVLPGLKGKIHADYLGVTVTQLLAHEGGVVANVDWWKTDRKQTTREQRAALLPVILKDAPANKPGTKYVYSNAGYVVAGAMAEAAANDSWENLLTTMLFKPLGMTSAGFGPPGAKGKLDQPWGHEFIKGVAKPTQHDNAPVLGPAGTVHVSLPDWAKFAAMHLQGAQGKGKLLKPESFSHLHTPTKGFDYAGGWLVGGGDQLAHDGSNTYWYARVRILPKSNFAVLAVVNRGGDEGSKAVDEIEKVTIDYSRDRLKK